MTTQLTISDSLHCSTLLAPYLSGEEVSPRYATSETICEVYGRDAEGCAYSVTVRHAGRGYVVRSSKQTKVQRPTRTSPDYYWSKAVTTKHTSERAAQNAAKARLDELRSA